MNLQDINNLNLDKLKLLLKDLKKYRDLKTKLGKRGEELFERELKNKDFLLVEYFGELNKEDVFAFSKKIYKDIFTIDVEITDIKFERNDDIKGGIKVYKNDEMYDMSFSKIEKLIK